MRFYGEAEGSRPPAEDELRLTCGARGRLLIAASFRT